MTAPVRIKICGITRIADALAAVRAGADALGFMLYEKSPRHVTRDAARDIICALPPFVARVGVFVNPARGEVEEAIRVCGFDTLQFHGEEDPAFCGSFGTCKVIKAFRVKDRASLESLPAYRTQAAAWLLDSYVPGQHGGTGAVFNWDLAGEAVAMGHPVLLAGGLTPDNIVQAVQAVQPYGVDVSSGVETSPGRKDPAKIQSFIAAVRALPT